MASTVTIDLRHVARGLDIPLHQVQATVELLDEGNTVPFITRYRKDRTGGLDEEQIREIQSRLGKMRLLADRKQTILRSIESQGKLTEKLTKQILSATTTKRLEDLYLPFKPKKQTLATLARSRGLEDLAREILEAAPLAANLDARAADFVNPDRQIPTAADALLGAGHILAEQFSEQAELRQRLREVLQRTGVLVSSKILVEAKAMVEGAAVAESSGKTAPPLEPTIESALGPLAASMVESRDESAAEASADNAPSPVTPEQLAELVTELVVEATTTPPPPAPPAPASSSPSDLHAVPETSTESPTAATSEPTADPASEAIAPPAAVAATSEHALEAASGPVPQQATLSAAAQRKLARADAKQAQLKKRELKKKKLDEKRIKAFRDYFTYREALNRIPPHRILAINRGERARVLRVKIECDLQAMLKILDEMLVPPDHPHAEYLRGCARDALARLILPSLERDVRREMTDRAEAHAVGVFARNLRNLLLQPLVHNHRVLAVDPGFKSGCKLAALDQFGNLLDHGVVFLIGKPERREEAKRKVIDLVQRFQLTLIAVGNGTACRDAEDFCAEMIENELKEQGVAYVIVNEAGASVYSISRIGREELPDCDATLRGAISIGRRLQDPLSELVKIDAASIGVGLYQHDVKAKHLRTSLDEVVESCVNYVGVDVNTASPALLGYISGLNQLTARRLYEYRRERGPFRTREQFRDVPGFGEATFVQAAGFLKILNGDNPLDSTWIHPESYAVADRVLERLHGATTDLREKDAIAGLAERVAQVDLEPLAKELDVGVLTLKDIVTQLVRPGRDPREDFPPPVFKRGIIKLEDLTPGMELRGTVLNVVDFGCFVDIGMHDSGLVHVSRLADRFIRDPHDVVAVGDVVKVWVVEIDKERRRVSLTMVCPGTERPKYRGHGDKSEGERPAGESAPPRSQTQDQRRPARRPEGQRPPARTTQGHTQGQEQDRSQAQGASQGQGARHPSRSARPQGGRRPPQQQHPPYRPKPRPKPLIPLTDAMKTGKEPMRTFGDLMQFYQARPDVTNEQPQAPSDPQTTTPESQAAAGQPPAVPAIDAPVEATPHVAPGVFDPTPEKLAETPILGGETPAPEEKSE
jgi:uncharacterized protein